MFRDLRAFVAALDAAGELARVRKEVSPVLEISAAADLESKRAAPGAASRATQRTDPLHHG
ncbi:MAG: 3-octaprenyl-4-hydroxybenzoate decarboxylase, partial [Phycisphaerales bacterium]